MSEPTEHKSTRTMAQHTAAVEALAVLIQMNGDLPEPYIVLHRRSCDVRLQLDTPEDFEMWRAALDVAPSSVVLHCYDELIWLKGACEFGGARLELTGHGVPLTVEQATSFPDTEQVPA